MPLLLPTTKREAQNLGWKQLDIILVTGDTYIDSPYIGAAIIGKVLREAGFRVGIIAQPEIDTARDITRLGEPLLFWGVTGGSVDSMVANYTATRKRRKSDDYTPGGLNNRRPDRAVIVYANLIRRYFKDTRPILLGGIEASLRRLAHYDYWNDRIRRSILFDAKADVVIYGMAEATVVEVARCLQSGRSYNDIPGLCYASSEPRADYLTVPSFAEVKSQPTAFIDMHLAVAAQMDPLTARGINQQQDTRYLIHNPPAKVLSQKELDRVHELDFERILHPFYAGDGAVRALDTIPFALITHRGCYGECSFCAIAVHQGRTVSWRSRASLLREAQKMTEHPDFKGIIADVGGPTANMYGFECHRKNRQGACSDKRCLFPRVCPELPVNHRKQFKLLEALRAIPGVKRVFVASGIRHDLVLSDSRGEEYLHNVVAHHTSGQLKIAPEHTETPVLNLMGKPGPEELLRFTELFNRCVQATGVQRYLTYYFMAAHPGCREAHMLQTRTFVSRHLKMNPEQVQIFTPTPSTLASVMYATGLDPITRQPLFIEKDLGRKQRQKEILTSAAKQKGTRGNPRSTGPGRPRRGKGL